MDEERLRILIVDDDEVDRVAVRRALRTAGINAEVSEAGDVSGALEALRGAAFDCVLLDFQLPGGDGTRVLHEARAAGFHAPMVMLTGHEDTQTAVELMKQGASDYLSKGSLSPERLGRSVRAAVRVSRAEAQAREAEMERERALSSRSRFYAAMSHELRTPINAILGYNDLLLAGVYGPLNAAQEGGLERSQRAARHLLELVNDVLDLSKLEAGKTELQVEEVDVPGLIEELFSTVGPLAEERGSRLEMHCASPSRIRTDPRRVRQVLLNLLSNAIKFGEGLPIEIRCGEGVDGGVVVEVADRGTGISPDDLPRIFDEFVQLPSANTGGTGLGLPISRRLSLLLGGTLEAESAPGAGSTFRLILPPTLAAEEEEIPAPGAEGAALV